MELEEDKNYINSEYETASEWQADFASDDEPPQDTIQEKKMVWKGDKIRVYKKILKLGREIFMPAKFDEIEFKFKICDNDNENIEYIADLDYKTGRLGLDEDIDDEMIQAISSMKKGEISIFSIERIGKNKSTMVRQLDSMIYFVVELKSFLTIINMFDDFNCMKTMYTRGKYQSRYYETDEIQITGKIMQGDRELVDLTMTSPEILNPEKNSNLLMKLLQSMKPEEDVSITVKPGYIEKMEDQAHPYYANMDKDKD